MFLCTRAGRLRFWLVSLGCSRRRTAAVASTCLLVHGRRHVHSRSSRAVLEWGYGACCHTGGRCSTPTSYGSRTLRAKSRIRCVRVAAGRYGSDVVLFGLPALAVV